MFPLLCRNEKLVWKWFFLFNFLKKFEKHWYQFFVKSLAEITSEAIRSWPFICWEVFLACLFVFTDSIFLLIIDLFRVFLSSLFSFFITSVIGYMFLGTHPFLFSCSVCWCVNVHSSLLWAFVFLWYVYSFIYLGFPRGSDGKTSACNGGDLGSIPGLGRSPGDGNGNPLQYSCLENPMDRGPW